MKLHIKHKCKIVVVNYQQISIISKYVTTVACKHIVHGLITPHINYSNSLYYGVPKCDIKKLQQLQNIAAELVLGKGKFDSLTA